MGKEEQRVGEVSIQTIPKAWQEMGPHLGARELAWGADKREMDFVGGADTLLCFFRTLYQTPSSTSNEFIHKKAHK